MPTKGLLWMIVALFVLLVAPCRVLSCVYDCHYNKTHPHPADPTVCAFESIEVELVKLEVSSWDGLDNIQGIAVPGYAMDLSGRGITDIAPNGLGCYEFVTPTADISTGQVYSAYELFGVNLDHNQLTTAPNMTTIGLTFGGYFSARHNNISSVAKLDIMEWTQGFRDLAGSYSCKVLLDHNLIDELPFNFLGMQCVQGSSQWGNLLVSLDYNRISAVHRNIFYTAVSQVTLSLEFNEVSEVESDLFSHVDCGGFFTINLKHNKLTSPPINMLNSTTLESITVLMDYNEISEIPVGILESPTFGTFFYNLTLSFSNNNISSLPDNLFQSNSTTTGVQIYFDHNYITDVGAIFSGFTSVSNPSFPPSQTNVSLRYNFIDSDDLAKIVGSYKSGISALYLDLSYNQVGFLPPYLFSGIGTGIESYFQYPLLITLVLKANNIVNVSDEIFSAPFDGGPVACYDAENSPEVTVNARGLFIDLSDNIHLELPQKNPFSFAQDGINGECYMNSLYIGMNLSNTSQTIFPIQNFWFLGVSANILQNPTETLGLVNRQLDLDVGRNVGIRGLDYSTQQGKEWNLPYEIGILNFSNVSQIPINFPQDVEVNVAVRFAQLTSLPAYSFGGFHGSLDLSHNRLSSLPDGALAISKVSKVVLQNNLLRELPNDLFDVSLLLSEIDLSYNHITQVAAAFTDNTPVLQRLKIDHNRIEALPKIVSNNRVFHPSDFDGNVLSCSVYSPELFNCTCAGTLEFDEFCNYGRCIETKSGCPVGEFSTGSCELEPWSMCISACAADEYLGANVLAPGTVTCIPLTNCLTTFGRDTPGYIFETETMTSDRVCSACSLCTTGAEVKQACTTMSNTVCVEAPNIAAIVVTVLLVMIGSVGGTSYFFLRKKSVKNAHELELSQLLLSDVTEEVDRMRQAWEISEQDVDLERKLASGAFGEVWQARWGHIPVAVKIPHDRLVEFDSQMISDFENESTFMQSIRHPNLLIFYGAGIRQNGSPFLVVELMSKGSMRPLLLSGTLEWSIRKAFASEIAQGMAHLHGLGCIHRDLKSDNCLVDDQLHVKVADFGNSRLLRAYYTKNNAKAEVNMELTSHVGTPLWMAPELVNNETLYGMEVDVYSFGIVMWEIVTMKTPWEDDIEASNRFDFFATLKRLLFAGVRPTLPSYSENNDYAAFVDIMKCCWKTLPYDRPTMINVSNMLNNA